MNCRCPSDVASSFVEELEKAYLRSLELAATIKEIGTTVLQFGKCLVLEIRKLNLTCVDKV
jgi:hypothetical protein